MHDIQKILKASKKALTGNSENKITSSYVQNTTYRTPRTAQLKSYKYSELLARMDEAIKEEYFLEANWIAYSILEDRLTSILKESGGGHEKIRMLGPKLIEIKARSIDNLNMRKAFFGDMFIKVELWKNKRNELMHAMADESKTTAQIDTDSMTLAIEGNEITRTLCAACRRFKKFNSKPIK